CARAALLACVAVSVAVARDDERRRISDFRFHPVPDFPWLPPAVTEAWNAQKLTAFPSYEIVDNKYTYECRKYDEGEAFELVENMLAYTLKELAEWYENSCGKTFKPNITEETAVPGRFTFYRNRSLTIRDAYFGQELGALVMFHMMRWGIQGYSSGYSEFRPHVAKDLMKCDKLLDGFPLNQDGYRMAQYDSAFDDSMKDMSKEALHDALIDGAQILRFTQYYIKRLYYSKFGTEMKTGKYDIKTATWPYRSRLTYLTLVHRLREEPGNNFDEMPWYRSCAKYLSRECSHANEVGFRFESNNGWNYWGMPDFEMKPKDHRNNCKRPV
ncbi:hypothetical protein PMAYCL1PPCAC_22152, partial [Pristionchus mayeri]